MLRFPIIVSGLLSLTALASPKERDLSFLSPAAQAVNTQVKDLHEKIRDKVEAVCAPDSKLRETIHAAMEAIDADSSKSAEEKRVARSAIFDQNKEQIEADRNHMRTCMKDNKSTLSVWKDIGKTLHTTCRLGGGERHHGEEGGFGRGGRFGGRGPLSDEQKQELATRLTSDACAQAIASAQSKLQ